MFKVSVPRTNLPIGVDGWKMPPFMGLTTWAAFIEGKKAEAMVAGDFVLFEDEVNPVMSALFENGVSVTALHNHFFFDEPKVYFMHIGGQETVEKLANGVKAALAKQKEVRARQQQPARGRIGDRSQSRSFRRGRAASFQHLAAHGSSPIRFRMSVIGRDLGQQVTQAITGLAPRFYQDAFRRDHQFHL